MPQGAATTALFERLRPGDAIPLDGPYGLAYLREESPRDLLLIAGGSGLSPMVSIAKAALARTDRRVRLYFGGRSPGDLAATSVLSGLGAGRLELVAAISDPAPTGGWTGRTGFIHEVAFEDLGDGLADHEVYFAGPTVMAQAVQAGLHQRGVPRDQVHFDEFY